MRAAERISEKGAIFEREIRLTLERVELWEERGSPQNRRDDGAEFRVAVLIQNRSELRNERFASAITHASDNCPREVHSDRALREGVRLHVDELRADVVVDSGTPLSGR